MRYFNTLHTHVTDLYRIVVAPAGAVPCGVARWERQESGLEGLASLAELKSFLHPRGYLIAEHSRFMDWKRHGDLEDVLGGEYHWVNTHMTLIEAACADRANFWRWGFTSGVPE